METILMLISLLALLAFIVGMFSPETVKCKSRGKVALIYLGIFFIFATIGSSLYPVEDETVTPHATSQAAEQVANNSETQQVSQEQEEQPVESSIGTPIEIGHFVYTVQSVQFRKTVGNSFFGETADGIYLIVNLSIKNISKETRTLDGSLFAVTDKSGVKYEYSVDASTALELSGSKTLFLKDCQPNITTKGVLAFEVPQKDEYYLHLVGSFWGSKSARVLLK